MSQQGFLNLSNAAGKQWGTGGRYELATALFVISFLSISVILSQKNSLLVIYENIAKTEKITSTNYKLDRLRIAWRKLWY